MFLVVGLGNPGIRYAYTRHNAGFLCADYIASSLVFPEFVEKHDSLVSEKVVDGFKVIIQKPLSFMNLSGLPVRKLVSFYKIPTENIFVVHDDIDLSPFSLRVKFAGGNGGHNGLRSIDGAIGKNYWRIRIGVGRPNSKIEVSDYVISNFYSDEIQELQNVLELVSDNIINLISSVEKSEVIKKMTKS
jgi:PTH1 family peptidyl-tRNA hydrolase